VDNELALISDGDGLAVIGESGAVERFIASVGQPSRDLELPRLKSVLATGAAATEAGSTIADSSGRWVKLTSESAQKMKQYEAMKGSTADVSRAILTKDGKTKHILEFARSTPGAALTNPAVLAGAAGIMAQLAMQQTMDEITDYLAAIDEKVDDILRAQKDAVVARAIGAGMVIDEAMTIREHGGRVNEVTWSKVQTVPTTIAETQAYALRQLDALAEKLESKTAVGDLAKVAKEAEKSVLEWLAVLARCFQLQDAIAVLELDRVLTASPEDLDGHRLGLRAARQDRRVLISRQTERLLNRLDVVATMANTKVLLHPTTAGAIVRSSNHTSAALIDFDALLGIERDRTALEARRWTHAAVEVRDRAIESGAEGLELARRRGTETLGRARTTTGRISGGLADRTFRRRSLSEKSGEDAEA
jgi:predicted transcriptional regulator